MNFSQMHERLRLELLRRIQRGTLSVSLLARQTGFGQPHLSNFLHGRRQLSLDALDRILAAQHLSASDLLVVSWRAQGSSDGGAGNTVPIVSHSTALFEPYVRPSAVLSLLQLPQGALETLHARVSNQRRSWQRFVVIRVPQADAPAMEPLILPDALVLIDRHYNSLHPYRPDRPNLYAVRVGAKLQLRFVDHLANRLVLRPYNLNHPVELLEVDQDQPPSELLVGRAVLTLNEH